MNNDLLLRFYNKKRPMRGVSSITIRSVSNRQVAS
jgi:hypothetical protein